MAKPYLFIISPASAKANNGNWRTAKRWADMLAIHYQVRIAQEWDGTPCVAMIALHARRSAPAILAYAKAFPERPLVVTLTGTDLYRDIVQDLAAQRSLQLATSLIVLQPAGLQALPAHLQAKTVVIRQSGSGKLVPKSIVRADTAAFKVIMIGHLRAEKDPATYMRAALAITHPAVEMLHVGGPIEPELAELARLTESQQPCYHWLGALPHTAACEQLQQAQLMVLSSVMEGGANVIVEALDADIPILASDISGNRGMLGPDYAGYFPVGDHQRLAQLIERAASDSPFLQLLQRQCRALVPLFAPAAEAAALQELMHTLLPTA